eukprot:scaffold1170_cov174-Amphora_coffeaeformis.AAC.13
MTPFVELEAVHVSKLSFHVSSWTNIRKAPILVHVEHVTATVKEPLHYVDRAKRRQLRQVTRGELVEMIRAGIIKARGAYNLFDRILDNLTIEVASVSINFQPWGRFKTRRTGPWTPPEIQLYFAGIHLVSVNEYGQEAPPEEVWRHNHHRSASGSLLIYKKLSMEYKISIKPANASEPIPLVTGRDNKLEVHLAMKRRIRDGEWLAVQIDTTIPRVDVNLPQQVIPHLVHALAGISYCVAKDRGFEDPLKPTSQTDHEQGSVHAPIVKLASSIDDVMEEEGDEEMSASEVPVQIEENEESSDEEESPSTADAPAPAVADSPAIKAATGRYALPGDIQNQPIILLPNGLTISEQLSLSLSVYDFKLRGAYAENGHFEIISKGCIGEAIWPKTSKEKGGYVQASVSYMTVQENYSEKLRTLLSGGVKFDTSLPLESPGKPLTESGRDETFPLYENRVIRPDPLSLRYTFPAQAFGLKSTVEFVKKLTKDPKASDEEEIQVLHETGLDNFEIVLDAGPWARILCFLANEKGGGFDCRWSSGDWSKDLTASMLLRPSSRLNLEECLQPTRQIFLDENQFVSSDLLNVTCRMTKINMRIPAAIQENLAASDIIVSMNEGMIVISSALPRTMLSGRIGTSVNGDDVKTKGVINFPNDPSDVSYQLEGSEDPGDRQRGIVTSRSISTFRVQFTMRGGSVKIVPVVQFYAAKQPQEFLAPTDATMIFCFEGEPPESEESNLTKIVLFTSIIAHRILVNFDVELVASALTSLLAHYRTVEDCARQISETIAESFVDESDTEASFSESGDEAKLLRSIRGRRLLVRRQILRSRETGGLSVAIGIQLAELSFHLWRQCIPTSSPLRPPSKNESPDDSSYVPLLSLMDFFLGELELGLEASFKKHSRRIVFKGCLSQASNAVCNVAEEMDKFMKGGKQSSRTKEMGEEEDKFELSELFSIGEDLHGVVRNPLDYAAAFRIEENLQKSRSWSFSADLCEASRLTFRPEELESLATLVFEALLQPNQFNASQEDTEEEDVVQIFPRKTVGGLFLSLVPEKLLPSNFLSLIEEFGPPKPDPIPVKSLDKILRKVLDRIPNNVRVVLIRSRVQDFAMFVPRDPRIDANSDPGLCFVIHSLDFLAQYLRSAGSVGEFPIFSVVARKDSTWADIVKRQDDGLFHEMKLEQSLSAVSEETGRNSRALIGNNIVPKFTSGYSYADSRLLFEIPSGVAVDGVEQLDRFLFCMLSFRDRCMQLVSIMSNLLQTTRTRQASRKDDKDAINPVALACSRTTSSLYSVLNILDEITLNLMQYDIDFARLLDEKDQALSKARLVSFMREKERLAAHAIVSAQKTGWLRIGVASKSGQRGSFTASLWPYWCILRKGIIISYSGPGDLQPLTMMSLENATLVRLGGGNRKKDLRRAFGLVDSTGAMHILIAGSDSDYFGWIHEMKRSVSSLNGVAGQQNNLLWGSEDTYSDSNERHSDDGGGISGQPQQRLLGRTISKAVQVAKASKQAVAERRLRRGDEPEPNTAIGPNGPEELPSPSPGEELNSVASADASEDTPSRRQQLRSKIAGMGQVTKRGLGSAMQIARQKGREVAERRRMRQHDESEMDETPSITLSESEITSSEPNLWNCPACTYANNGQVLACEMCNTPRKPDQSFGRTGTIEADEPSVARSRDEATPEPAEFSDSNQRVGMRLRLGNAVRSVRQNNTDTAPESGRSGGRFGFRRRGSQNSDGAQHDGAPEPVTLKQVTVNGPLQDQTHPFGDEYFEAAVVQQKRLDKVWFVRVKVVDGQPVHSGAPSEENFNSLQPNIYAAARSEMIQIADVEAKDDTIPLDLGASGTTGKESEQKASAEPTEEPDRTLHSEPKAVIEVFRQTEDSGWLDRAVSSVSVSLSAILALHAEISESVGRLPPPASFPDIEPRSQSGSLTRSLGVALGLTALDTVRITGMLLSGLLQYHPDSGEYSVKPISAYHGKCTM